MVKFDFTHSKPRKQPFIAKNLIRKCQISNSRGTRPPPSDALARSVINFSLFVLLSISLRFAKSTKASPSKARTTNSHILFLQRRAIAESVASALDAAVIAGESELALALARAHARAANATCETKRLRGSNEKRPVSTGTKDGGEL